MCRALQQLKIGSVITKKENANENYFIYYDPLFYILFDVKSVNLFRKGFILTLFNFIKVYRSLHIAEIICIKRLILRKYY